MTKKERQNILNKILYDAYRSLFLDFKAKVKLEIISKIPAKFSELYADEECKEFLNTSHVGTIIFQIDSYKWVFCAPDFNNCQRQKPSGYLYSSSKDGGYEKERFRDIICPKSMDTVTFDNIDLYDEYHKLWDAYIDAYIQVESLLYSYKSDAKFASEFPEFAKYLPEKVIIQKLPAVQVDTVRTKLASVGIPAEAPL
jgi:hypothetical protein